MNYPSILMLLMGVLCSSAVFAKTIAVPLGPYTMVAEDRRLPESAAAFRDRLEETARSMAWEISPDVSDRVCESEDCLKQVKYDSKTDQAIFVEVEQIGAKHTLTLYSLGFEPKTETVTGPVSKVYKKLDEMTREILKSSIEAIAAVPPASKKPDPVPALLPAAEDPPPPASQSPPAGPHPRAFWASFGLTLGFAVGGLVMEGVGYSKLKDVNEKPLDERTEADVRFQQPLRIAEAVMFGAAFASAVVATVVGIRVLKNKKEDAAQIRVAPSVGQEGGALMLKGTF